MAADISFPYVNLKAPRKAFTKDKESGDIRAVARIAFDAVGVDDETLFSLTQYADTSVPVKVTISIG